MFSHFHRDIPDREAIFTSVSALQARRFIERVNDATPWFLERGRAALWLPLLLALELLWASGSMAEPYPALLWIGIHVLALASLFATRRRRRQRVAAMMLEHGLFG